MHDSKREQECRTMIEGLTGKSFPKSRPAWLVGSRGYRLELDGFCEELGIAFEHQGVQHFEYVPFFQTKEKFQRTVELDREKKALCAARGVQLIEVRWDADIQTCISSAIAPAPVGKV